MNLNQYKFQKQLTAISMGILTASFVFTGCSAKTEKEDPLTTICGGVIQEDGKNPAYAYMKATIDGDQVTSQFYRYFYDEGWSDEQLHKAFKNIEEIVRDGNQLILISSTDTDKLDSSKGNQHNMEACQKLIQMKFSEVSSSTACDITEEQAAEEAKSAVDERQKTVESRKAIDKQKEEKKNQESESNAQASGIRPEFQKSMDEFLAFYQQYADFMKNYQNSDDITSMMTEYMNMMSQYSKVTEAMDQVDESSLSPEELQLYIETTAEIQKILVSVY